MHYLVLAIALTLISSSALFATEEPEPISQPATSTSVLSALKHANTPDNTLNNITLLIQNKPYSEVCSQLYAYKKNLGLTVFHCAVELAIANTKYDRTLKVLLNAEYALLQRSYVSHALSLCLPNGTNQTLSDYIQSLKNFREEPEEFLSLDDMFEESNFRESLENVHTILKQHDNRCKRFKQRQILQFQPLAAMNAALLESSHSG